MLRGVYLSEAEDLSMANSVFSNKLLEIALRRQPLQLRLILVQGDLPFHSLPLTKMLILREKVYPSSFLQRLNRTSC